MSPRTPGRSRTGTPPSSLGGNTISSTNTYAGVGNFSVSFKRQTQVYWIVAGTQTPYIIARGPLTADGQVDFDPTNSEMPLDLMLLNSQAPMSIQVSNQTPNVIPNSGTPFTLTFTMSQAAIHQVEDHAQQEPHRLRQHVRGVANSTDVGGSGGLGPGTLTLINNTAVYAVCMNDYLPSLSALHLI